MPNFLGRLQTILFGAAIGRASSDSVSPVLEPVRQHAWYKNQNRILDAATAAEARAKGIITEDEAEFDAARNGIAANRFGVLLRLAQSYPGLADLDKMSNRSLIKPPDVVESLTRHGIPEKYHQPIIELFNDLLSVADVAAGIQQGHLPNHGGTPDSGPILPPVQAAVPAVGGQVTADPPDGAPPSKVPLTTIKLDPVVEAAGQGYDVSRLKVRANLAGLPPGAAELLTMWNRELIDEDSVDAGIREGHLKTKWAQAYKRLRWNVLGAAEYAGLHLRGWITAEEMYKGGKLTGHTKDQMDKMYLNRGRPLAPVQAFTAWARGAPHPKGLGYTDRPGTFDEQDFLKALQQSDVRTEYGPILWHNRYAYPPLFQLGRLAQAGAIPEERVRTILQYERYEPQDIDRLVTFWYAGTAAKAADPWVTRARTQLWSAIHRSFIAGELDRAAADSKLETLIPDLGTRSEVLDLWTIEDESMISPLTPTQIKKAYSSNEITLDEAVARLVEQNYSVGDATLFLQS